MIDLIRETMTANQAEAAHYPQAVQIWMRVMAVAFLSSAVFAPWKQGARWILAGMVINIAGLIIVKMINPDLSRYVIGTTVHLIFWTLALYLVWRPQARARRQADFQGGFGRVYQVWLVAASVIMAASLVLDARSAISWVL